MRLPRPDFQSGLAMTLKEALNPSVIAGSGSDEAISKEGKIN